MGFSFLNLLLQGATLLHSARHATEGDATTLPYEKLTLVGVLAIGVIAFMRRWVVPGSFYDDLRKENESLRSANEQLRQLGRSATGTAEQLARSAQPKAEASERDGTGIEGRE